MKTSLSKEDRLRSYPKSVRRSLLINNYMLKNEIGHKSFLSLLLIVTHFTKFQRPLTTSGIYVDLYGTFGGSTMKLLRSHLYRLVNKGYLRKERVGKSLNLYPTEKSLKEISVFI